jgi:serine/threonine-protein kinase RsbW
MHPALAGIFIVVRTWRRPSRDIRFCLVFEREKLSVPVMRQVLGNTLRGVGVCKDSVADILLASTEACSNVVLHAGPAGAYEVTVSIHRSGCRVEIRDEGRGIRREARFSEELAEHGRGFEIMRGCMDDVTLRSAPGQGTSVVLDKRIRWEARIPVPA